MVTVLEADRAERNYWRDLWRYRELFQILAWRDFAVRYRQTVVGVTWAGLRPLLTMIILTVIFNRVAGLQSDGPAPYALLVMAGILPWTFFATGLADASGSLLANTNLLTKVYFPRMILPTATILVSVVDFVIQLAIMAAMMAWYHFVPGWHILTLPLFMAMAFLAALGPALWITAISVRYRDFRFVTPFLVQFGLYVTPVGFAFSKIPEAWRMAYSLNPMVGVINAFRWAILGGDTPFYGQSVAISAAVIALFLWQGVRQFRKLENSFADLI